LLGFAHERLQTSQPAVGGDYVVPGSGMMAAMGGGGPGPSGGMMGPGGTPIATQTTIVFSGGPDPALVLRTGHAWFALLFGFVGGVTAKWFYLTRSPQEDEQPR
jgi:hypothetical protein